MSFSNMSRGQPTRKINPVEETFPFKKYKTRILIKHSHIHVCTATHTGMHAHMYTLTHAHKHTYTHMHKYIHIYPHYYVSSLYMLLRLENIQFP